jgi:hypothetical protein
VNYHLRYWLLRARRYLRWPFSRWARHTIGLDELVADLRRDPEMRTRLNAARARLRLAWPPP